MRTGGKRFDQERPFLTLGIVLAVWLILPVGLKYFGRATFFEATAPFAVSASYARDLQEFWNLKARSKDELISMGRDLGRLTASYSESVQQNSELEAQIQRLEGLLHMPPREHYRQEPARVVRRDFTGWWQTMTIRKGSNQSSGVSRQNPRRNRSG